MACWKRRWTALLLALAMLLALAACGQDAETGETVETETAEEEAVGGEVPEAVTVEAETLPDSVTVVVDGLTGTYDPRYAQTEGDLAVARLTGASLLTVDTGGGFIYEAASAGMTTAPADVSVETSGSNTVYTITLREDLGYTAEQLEALYLELLDGDYAGPRTVSEAPIEGLDSYQSGVSDADVETFGAELDYGRDEDLYAQCLEAAWYAALEEIAEDCLLAAETQPVDTFGISVTDSDMEVTLAMALRGFGEIDSSGAMTGLATGTVWTPTDGDVPDWEDFYNECRACYLDSAADFSAQELSGEDELETAARLRYIAARAAESGSGVTAVTGIQVLDSRTLTITVESTDLRYVYNICDVILPDVGPYTLAGESGGAVVLTANAAYFGGTARIATLYLQSDGEGDINASEDGYGNYSVYQNEQSFGYIGLNAENVKVGSSAGSAQSVALRQALISLLSVFRERTVATYYGDDAAVLQVPTAADSWTAPTEDWTYPETSDEALEQARSLLQMAGYTWDDSSQTFTEAPEGASLTFTLLIPAGGSGDHTAATLAKQASATFTSLGLTLEIEDVSEASFWQQVSSGGVQLWAAAWEDAADTDPTRWYTLCGLSDDYLTLCENALTSGTASAYRAAYDILEQWQVVLPFYQRRSQVYFSGALPVIHDRLTADDDWVRWLTDLSLNAS